MNYHEHLKTEYWREVARRVKTAAGFKCQVCNSPRDLVAHHRTYAHVGDEMNHLGDLICLCAPCHERFHQVEEINGKRRATKMPDTETVHPPRQDQRPPASKKERRRQLRALRAEMQFLKQKANIEKALEAKKKEAARLETVSARLVRAATKRERRIQAANFQTEAKKALASLYDHEGDMPQAFPVTIDESLMAKFRTKAGGITTKTMLALGMSFPPVQGWPRALIGKTLTEEQCRAALTGRESRSTLKTLGLLPSFQD